MSAAELGDAPQALAHAAALAGELDTPFFAYDLEAVRARIALLRGALPPGSTLLYAAKANPHEAVLQTAASNGCGVELASCGELARAIGAGVDPTTALLVGPAKSDRLLDAALRAGVDAVAIESTDEIARLDAAARRAGVRDVDVLVRLSLDGARGALRMAGHQFGVGLPDVPACGKAIAASRRLRFAGFHGFLASQLLDVADIVHNTRLVLETAAALAAELDGPPVLDVGGGFGLPYTSGDEPLDLRRLRAGLAHARAQAPDGAELVFESGRFLAGPPGVLVTRVVEVKTIAGRRFVLLDGGTNASGLFGGANAIRPLRHTVVRDGEPVLGGAPAHICGPLCTPMDRLATNVPCDARRGDLVVWWNMGAYGLTAAPTGFLSFPPPAEHLIDGG